MNLSCRRGVSRIIVRSFNVFANSHVVQSWNFLSENPEFEESDRIRHAHQVFDEIPEMDVVSATAAIGSFMKQNRHEEAICLFKRFFHLGIRPNEFTFGTVIGSSTLLRDAKLSRQLHACALKMGMSSNVFVGSSVLNCYVKLASLEEARKAFQDTHEPNVVSRTNLISGYLKDNNFEEALLLFGELAEKNVVSWNAMIGGCSQTGRNEEAVNLFVEMLREGMVPNESTFPCAITAVSNIPSHGTGKSFHACAIKFLGQRLNVFVGNSLISLYARCGNMEDSLLVFTKLQERNVVSWNSIIWGYAHNGRGSEAVAIFERVNKQSNLKPNRVTLLGLLFACNHSGLVDKGCFYFKKAVKDDPNSVKPEHYACLVDMLSRSGRFKEAEEFIHNLPFDPGIGFWKALLGGCQIHSNNPLSELAASKIIELDPRDVSSFLMLSNAHSVAGRWHKVSDIRREMKEKGMVRVPGCSWIELRGKVRVFVTADKNKELKGEIYGVLKVLVEHLSEFDPFISAIDDDFLY
ncbi:PREDICTED: pentatricopeptide repeat-containing protein At5g42450, mitochondrial [Tarenaya hassleriana]|uniref:pentatricopeptide repeat-containing protein At5g42450, mitochondrial n=1 Tax=Tarenaya hassleriana TaxID=28532 RepID=UPI00053C7ED3|nr:PREDICTED: pentatricopeptide repeat-containing protein At5g42450, mitochondrial [Tarenaya hassleriana]